MNVCFILLSLDKGTYSHENPDVLVLEDKIAWSIILFLWKSNEQRNVRTKNKKCLISWIPDY